MKRKCSILLILLLCTPLVLYGLTVQEEKKYGKEIYREIAQSAPINNDPYIALYLRNIKTRVESAISLPFPIILTVIQSPSLDAFATIGGYVYVTTGLISMCDTEEELAGVLAHEFAHVSRRHVAKRLEKQKQINIGMIAAMALSMLVPSPQGKEATLAMGMASAQALSLKYSREDEDEADRFGAQAAARAGYGGLGIADFLKKLRIAGGDKTLPQYLLTHPYHEERIIKLESTWRENRVTVDTSFFPYLITRAKILHTTAGTGVDDTWINRYMRNKDDPSIAYGAALVYVLRGKKEDAIEIIKGIKSPYKNLLLGEILFNSQRFTEAIDVLTNEQNPIGQFFLARAYEMSGQRDTALLTFREIEQYGNSFPEIYYRYGMLAGRMGNEAEGFEYLGRYYLETGRTDLARTNLEKAITRYGINSPKGQELVALLGELTAKR